MSDAEKPQQTKQTVWLCRHGNRIDFVDPTWQGTDPHLSPDGVEQARETGERLRSESIRRIFASPFLRTVETAHHIAEALDLPIHIEHGACEWLNPEWFPTPPRLMTPHELRERFPRVDTGYRSVLTPAYPEDGDTASRRAGEAARLVADRFREDLLLIGHGHSVGGMAVGLMEHTPEFSCGMCALLKIIRQNGTSTMELTGDTSHLRDGDRHADRFA
jgi:broad specificity phosphatase PhoE